MSNKLFLEAGPLAEWPAIAEAYASRLLWIEAGRVIDRIRLTGRINDAQVEHLHVELQRLVTAVRVLELSDAILLRAAGAMPTALGTLDALHLATALELAPTLTAPLVIATHDEQLTRAARASGFTTVGV